MLNFNKAANQSGRSMIEMLGVLAIVGVLSAGGIAGYSMAMQNYKSLQLIEKVQTVAMQARALYKGNYEGSKIQDLVDSGRISDYKDPFGGNLSMGVSTLGSNVLSIVAHNIPAEACVDILTADYGEKGVFEGFNFNDNVFGYVNNRYPITMTKAISLCEGGNKKIIWYFKN